MDIAARGVDTEADSGLASRPTILVVDDVASNLAVMSDVLQPQYRVLVATSGLQALEIMQGANRPDLVLLDIMMPGMDGHEVLRRMRACTDLHELPAISTSDGPAAATHLGRHRSSG